ncbi:MAG: hypothetical protein LBD15_01320 [Holosporales bacterium]|jgi:phosphohistidine swiveling domain-containing protein|nr:hypothetical protein [Holosporales bacterium]
MQCSTKAQTLKFLTDLCEAKILEMLVCSHEMWERAPGVFLEEACQKNWPLFIVRSSATTEDQENTSNAGKYTSLLNVPFSGLRKAIETVFASYGDALSSKDEVLLQPMLQDVAMSGVLFTKDPNSGAPYYVINFSTTQDTTAVTAGATAHLNTVFIARCVTHHQDTRLKKLLLLAHTLEKRLDTQNLDIEFAFDQQEDLFLFQVRPLVCTLSPITNQQIWLDMAAKRFDILNKPHPYLKGRRALFGVMPDWNPAEIIGVRPKPLALSLYKTLITDSTWAYQRDNYGYRNLRSFPLLVDFIGLPYVDVRVSFNSFLPKTLDESLSDRLADYYLDTLETTPHLHDKIEFEIAHSCYTFDTPERLKSLQIAGFSKQDLQHLQESLRELTNTIIRNDTGLWVTDAQKIEELKHRHDTILHNKDFDFLTKIYWMVEDCRRYGTLPFAGLARAGFIAVQILNSMVSIGILSKDQRSDFLNSLNSVSSQMAHDLATESQGVFLEKYGHLRPGTYDILSPRYDEAPSLYFDWTKVRNEHFTEKMPFTLSISQMQRVEHLLEQHKLDHNVVGIFTFMKAAIEGREYAKFVFTKTLSNVLSLFKGFGAQHGLDAEELSYVDIKSILEMYASSWDILQTIQKSIELGKKRYTIASQILLPPLITKTEDFYSFALSEDHPNFITRKSVTAPILKDLAREHALHGKILFIPSADPGFDWIFTHGIAGFVTTYGGVNSHMAIRAGELGLPAIIGAGEKLYTQWAHAQILHIDCANQKVEVIR